jgi:hypothetical protein
MSKMIKHEMQDKIREKEPRRTRIEGKSGKAGLLFAFLIAMLALVWSSDWSGLGGIPERSALTQE